MTNDTAFLSGLMSRPWSPNAKYGFRPVGLFVGKGTNAVEVAVARSSGTPTRTALLVSWKGRRGGRAAPVLLIVLHPGGAALCGASGEAPPVYPKANAGQVERLCREALAQPDRHAALRFLAQALPSLETALPGLNNEGLVALHELHHGAPGRRDWADAARKAAQATGISLPNEIFEAALRNLLVIETPEGAPGPVDFRSLGVREFGTVYEGLLESELALAETDLVLRKQKNKLIYMPARDGDPVAVDRGEIYLHNRSGARKSSGIQLSRPRLAPLLRWKCATGSSANPLSRLSSIK